MIELIYIFVMSAIISQGLYQKAFLLKEVLLNFPLHTVCPPIEFQLSYPFHSACLPTVLQLNNILLK